MFFYSKISCKVIGKVLYNIQIKGRENKLICWASKHKPWHFYLPPGFSGLPTALMRIRPGICGKYFLSFPQKNLWPEKTEIAKCLLFHF